MAGRRQAHVGETLAQSGVGFGGRTMAGMDGSNGRANGDEDDPRWTQLPADKRAEFIDRDVQIIIEESQAATQKIVDAAMQDFVEDYSGIESKPMRDAVLHNIIEPRYLVDTETAESAVPFIKEPARPGAMMSVLSMLFHMFGS
jgi:hypothetical protein